MTSIIEYSITDLRSARAVIKLLKEQDPNLKEIWVSGAVVLQLGKDNPHLEDACPDGCGVMVRHVYIDGIYVMGKD